MNAGQIFEFEVIIFFKKILQVDILVEYPVPNTSYLADLFFNFNEMDYIGEIKYYRSPLAQMNLLIRAAQQITTASTNFTKYTVPVLIVSCYISQMQRKALLEEYPNLVLIDRFNLLNTLEGSTLFNSSLLLDSDSSVIPHDEHEFNLVELFTKKGTGK